MYLCELALALADETLKKGGDFLVKLFQGEGFDEFSKEMKQRFDKVIFRKPKASRPRSREVYALGRGYRS
jgi:23S rRNA (uridine2552-2'-O)-methyltransferase